ncbi:hypothetical protein ACE2AJ_19955 [Aquihabitans daechungensis]|uniref:hypothetical protein n=1 Tax=Aquihabitans daechungensis TaxID=1052257 RepID=UPI003B9FC6AE
MSTEIQPAETWAITSRNVGGRRVEAVVDGVPLWVESDKLPLADVPEAWATAFCLPAARAEVRLRVERPVDPTWRAAANANVTTTSVWWGGARTLELDAPDARGPRWHHRLRPRPARGHRPSTRATGRALCFTGGVDSFFSLLRDRHGPTHLLYVIGFDVEVDDAARADRVVDLVKQVAKARRLTPVIVRTNLRTHPRFASISWEHTHGAALAAVGHLLQPRHRHGDHPAVLRRGPPHPVGARPDLDPRWSVPGRLEIEHGDATERRLDRIVAIAHDPLVHRHLRVCWQNVGSDLNCGRCEKCVRTMTTLAGAGVIDDCTTFPSRDDLPDRVEALGTIPVGLTPMWSDVLATDLRPDERRSIEALIERSSTR